MEAEPRRAKGWWIAQPEGPRHPGRFSPLQVPWTNPQQGWNIHTGDKITNCPNNSSYDKTLTLTAKQEYLSKDQPQQISPQLHLPLRLEELIDDYRDRTRRPIFRNEVPTQNIFRISYQRTNEFVCQEMEWTNLVTFADTTHLPRPSYRVPSREGKRGEDRGNHGWRISRTGLNWIQTHSTGRRKIEIPGHASLLPVLMVRALTITGHWSWWWWWWWWWWWLWWRWWCKIIEMRLNKYLFYNNLSEPWESE